MSRCGAPETAFVLPISCGGSDAPGSGGNLCTDAHDPLGVYCDAEAWLIQDYPPGQAEPPNSSLQSITVNAAGERESTSTMSSSTDSTAISSPPVRSSNSERLF